MSRTLSFFYSFISLSCIALGASIAMSSDSTSGPAVDIPTFYNGYNIYRFSDHSNETVKVSYLVKAIYPAAEVLEFYDRYFNARGWISSFETCQRNWYDAADTAEKSESSAKLLFASWEHAGSNRKVLLWIRTETVFDERPDEVVVEYQIQPLKEK